MRVVARISPSCRIERLLLLFIVIIAFCSSRLPAQQLSFMVQNSAAAPGSPNHVAAVDVTHDNKADLVVSDYSNNRFYVLKGNGDGTFQSPVVTATGANPGRIYANDFDNDLRQDIVVLNEGEYTVQVFRGHNDQTFTLTGTYTFSSQPYGAAFGDFNEDGNDDIAVAFGDSVGILIQSAPCAFDPYVPYQAGHGARDVAAGLLDPGSHVDLVVSNYSNDSVSVLLGTGLGTFGPRTPYFAAYSPGAVALLDVNGDSKLDLVATSEATDSLSILRGNGAGGFLAPVFIDMFSHTTDISVLDYNGDHHDDLAVTTRAQTVGLLMGLGTNAGNMFYGPYFYGSGAFCTDGSAADFNGDSYPDLALAEMGQEEIGLLMNDFGTIVGAQGFATRLSPGAVTVEDFDYDGYYDIAVAYPNDNKFGVLLSRGGIAFDPPVIYPAQSLPAKIMNTEINGAGGHDVVVTNFSSNTVSVYAGAMDGTFGSAANYPTGNGPVGVTAADFDHDNANELVVANYNDNTIAVLHNQGNGTFDPAATYAAGSAPVCVVAGDFNQDDETDVIVTNQNSATLMYFSGIGDGTLNPGIAIPSIATPREISFADLNGDPFPDLVVSSLGVDSIAVFLGNGDGSFRPYVPYFCVHPSTGIKLSDLDHDGSLDLVVSQSGGENLAVLRGRGDGTFEAPKSFSGGGATQGVEAIDMTNDNKPEIIASNDGGSVTILTNSSIAPPVFQCSPSPLHFPNVLPGNFLTDSVYVTNQGEATLSITAVASDNDQFTVSPSSATITQFAGQIFYVTYTPTTFGATSGHIVFTDNSSTAPDTVLVDGRSGISASIIKLSDADGDTTTTGDRSPRRWHLELYKNFYTPGHLVASADSSVLFAGLSTPGIYIAVESDSGQGWTRINGNRTRFDTLDIGLDGVVDTFVNYRAPKFHSSSSSLDLGGAWLGDSSETTVTISNTGGSILGFPSVTSSNTQFAVGAVGPYSSGSGSAVRVVFTPASHGLKSGTIYFHHNAPNGIDSITVTGTGLDTLTYRSFAPDSIAAAYKQKPVKKPKPGKPVVKPNYANLIQEVIDSGATLRVGVPHQFYSGGKEKAYIQPKKYSDVFGTFNDKGVTDSLAPHGFDITDKGKLIVKKQTKVSPKVQNNRLKSGLMALQIAIAASDHGKTPPGFADLVYNDGASNPLNGLTLDSIASRGSDMMTNWQNWCPEDYTNMDTTVRAVNLSFSGPYDTTSWISAPGLRLSGVRALGTAAFLRKVPRAIPRTVPRETPDAAVPGTFELAQNYPNPFNPTTTIEFALPATMNVTLRVYDVLGREVALLLDRESYDAGRQGVQFDASALASGLYFYRVTAEPIAGASGQRVTATGRMMLVK